MYMLIYTSYNIDVTLIMQMYILWYMDLSIKSLHSTQSCYYSVAATRTMSFVFKFLAFMGVPQIG